MQAIVDHHHADVKTASKVRFAEPGTGEPGPEDAPSPPLTDSDEKDKDDKVIINNYKYFISMILKQMKYTTMLFLENRIKASF